MIIVPGAVNFQARLKEADEESKKPSKGCLHVVAKYRPKVSLSVLLDD